MSKKIDIINQKFNHLTVLEDLGGGKVLCQCDCENKTVLECYKKNVKSGRQKSCGCASRKKGVEYIVGQQFGNWVVLQELGYGKVLCECQCKDKTVRELYKKAVVNGQTKSCGCMRATNCNDTKQQTGSNITKYKDQTFGEWTVIDRIPNTMKLLCRCSCGVEKPVYIQHLLNGESKSCGHNNTKFNREPWQIDTVSSKEKMENYLKSLGYKPRISELMRNLSLTQTGVYSIINKYSLNNYVEYLKNGKSDMEEELYQFVRSIYNGEIIKNERKLLSNQYELDIYIPELKIGIEFNGNYWHSDIQKEPEYHQLKTLSYQKIGVRVIHIFEYEWINNNDKIKKFIENTISTSKIYARELSVVEVDSNATKEFLCNNHLQGWATSSINIALVDSNAKIFGIMTFGKPRFSNDYEYELIRLCFDYGVSIVGGTEKMFKYFIRKYNPTNIISYSDLSKFGATVYTRLGFKPLEVTNPNYVWCNYYTGEVLTRYQTTKQKLVDKGLGSSDQTEDEIMRGHDYLKIYNSGNLKLIWNRNEKEQLYEC